MRVCELQESHKHQPVEKRVRLQRVQGLQQQVLQQQVLVVV
jgi:hypothetical protein